MTTNPVANGAIPRKQNAPPNFMNNSGQVSYPKKVSREALRGREKDSLERSRENVHPEEVNRKQGVK